MNDMYIPNGKQQDSTASTRRARSYLSRDCSARERAERAARCFVNQLPLPLPGGQQVIEAPTLQQLADAYGVSIPAIHEAFRRIEEIALATGVR